MYRLPTLPLIHLYPLTIVIDHAPMPELPPESIVSAPSKSTVSDDAIVKLNSKSATADAGAHR